MKKQTLKLLSFIALSLAVTKVNAQPWTATGANITATSTASNIITFQPSTTGAIRGLAGNTNNYFEVYANTDSDNGASLFLNSNTSTGGSPAGSITMMSSSNVATDDAFHILNHPNSSTWNSLFKIKNNGKVEIPGELNISGTTKTWDVQAFGNGYINNTLNVGTTTTAGAINCNGTVSTWDVLAQGNGYINNTLNVGTTTTAGAINCNGTVTTWDILAQGNGYIDGKLRIGDSILMPSGYKLYVQDGILTEKLKVAVHTTTHWSDFVFADNYELAPLNDVENFINKNKHLPGVPSAEEVVKEGIDVATMDAKLLQKVEELTLYVIQQQKEINELKKKLKK